MRSMQSGQRRKIQACASGVADTLRVLAKIERGHARNDAIPHLATLRNDIAAIPFQHTRTSTKIAWYS
jgi:hypothetical protein